MDIENFFSDDFGQTIVRFFICLLVNWSIIEFFYYRKSNRRDFYFTFVLMTVAIFFLVFFMMGMERGKATMGVGLGLFGIFSIMRYRTDTMPVREMTYLFLIVCLAVVHAMASDFGDLALVDIITVF
jgi:magnesium-transporting ATPase (P-type)